MARSFGTSPIHSNSRKGKPPKLLGDLGTSAGETHQRLLPNAKIVKVFNTVGHALYFRPQLEGGVRGDMFLCGDDAQAKNRTSELLGDFGWNAVDVGGIDASHYVEATCMIWMYSAMRSNDWKRAFRLVPVVGS
jgi:8-hydroxy-5-deazaflavin:NADPH oxidoreductase